MSKRAQRENTKHEALYEQLRNIVHHVKKQLYNQHTQSTEDFVNSLLAKWLRSDEYRVLVQQNPDERSLGTSARHWIINHLRRKDRQKRRGIHVELSDIVLPDDSLLEQRIADVQLLMWLDREISELEAGRLDPTIRFPPASPATVGQILRLEWQGMTQREIAVHMKLNLASVSRRKALGITYLAKRRSKTLGLTPQGEIDGQR